MGLLGSQSSGLSLETVGCSVAWACALLLTVHICLRSSAPILVLQVDGGSMRWASDFRRKIHL